MSGQVNPEVIGSPVLRPDDSAEMWATPATVRHSLKSAFRLLITNPTLIGMSVFYALLTYLVESLPSGTQSLSTTIVLGNVDVIAADDTWLDLMYKIVFAPLFCSIFVMAVEQAHAKRKIRLDALFTPALYRVPALYAVFLLTLMATTFGIMLCVIPGFFFFGYLALAPFRVALDRGGPISSLRWSWEQPYEVRNLLVRLTVILALALLVCNPDNGVEYTRNMSKMHIGIPADESGYVRAFSLILESLVTLYFVVAYCWVYLEHRAGRLKIS